MKINPQNWTPIDIPSMDERALKAIKSNNNILLMTEPQAGKTELLAQKACYLLQTNTCKKPSRILALSATADTAYELQEQVAKRCEHNLYKRFDSYTFDSFAKSILDRFRNALPETLRPTKNYKIENDGHNIGNFLACLNYQNRPAPQALINILKSRDWDRANLINMFIKDYVINFRLDDNTRDNSDILNWAANNLWAYLLQSEEETGKSKPLLQMVSRLSAYLIDANRYIKKSLQASYGHLLIDNYHEITPVDYDFFSSCFLGNKCKVIAAANKERQVKLWPKVHADLVSRFRQDFAAEVVYIDQNFKCAPRLLPFQSNVTNFINDMKITKKAKFTLKEQKDEGKFKLLTFRDDEQEAVKVTDKIISLIDDEGIPAEKIGIIYNLQTTDYAQPMIAKLLAATIKSRVEDEYQDLREEEFVEMVLNFIKFVFDIQGPTWNEYLDMVSGDHGIIAQLPELEMKLEEFKQQWQTSEDQLIESNENLENFIQSTISLVSPSKVRRLSELYNEEYLDAMISSFIKLFGSILQRKSSIVRAVREFEGFGVVPCLTIDQVQNREFKVLFFIGLEDGMFVNFPQKPKENVSALLSLFKHATDQIYITYSGKRKTVDQTKTGLKELYDLLTASNVEINDLSKSDELAGSPPPTVT
ncbi:MAG: ATP-dependent helicase [Bacteriovoracaceae bacterium]|nr:ATP-dependent helicase [Bacteriovoracaceae bacterium]